MSHIKIIECPRDAMQGIHEFISTEIKINYINSLLECGFDTLDFGSFVSPKAIPQMRDTGEVLKKLNPKGKTKLLAIVANERGAEDACHFDEIDILGYPFSISETFQQRNTGASLDESMKRVNSIFEIARKSKKEVLLYLSMGFGNPYGENWSPELVTEWSEKLKNEFEVKTLALSDTIGCATPEIVNSIFTFIIPEMPKIEFGAHLHVRPENALEIIDAAYNGGCRRFDGAIRGFGGCPMATDDLTGNMPTEKILEYLERNNITTEIDKDLFEKAYKEANSVFSVTN